MALIELVRGTVLALAIASTGAAQEAPQGSTSPAGLSCERRVPFPVRSATTEQVSVLDLRFADDLPRLLQACIEDAKEHPKDLGAQLRLGRVLVAARDERAVTHLLSLGEGDRSGSGELTYLLFEAYLAVDRKGAGPTSKSRTLISRVDAEGYLRDAATKGHPEALYEISRRLAEGLVLRRDPSEARIWFERAFASADHPDRVFNLRHAWIRLTFDDPASTAEELERAFRMAEELSAESVFAKLEVARALRSGRGTKADPARARAMAQDLSTNIRVIGPATALLAEMLIGGEGGAKDVPRAVALLKGKSPFLPVSPEAMTVLARLYVEGLGTGRDPAQAVRLLARFSENRAPTVYPLADVLRVYDFELPKDDARALRFALEEQADAGSVTAMLALAKLNLVSHGQFRDEAGGYRLLEAAEREGSDEAAIRLALRYADWADRGTMVMADWSRNTIARLKDKDYAQAFTAYGRLQRRGVLFPQDDVSATKALREGAERGDLEAMVLLAEAYSDGRGISTDRGQQFRWLREAARLGSLEARRKLSWMVSTLHGDITLREGLTEAVALNADQPYYVAPIGITASLMRRFSKDEIARAVLDGFRLAPAALSEEAMVRIVRQIPAEIRVEMESILVRSGRYRGEAGGHFGPDARAALRAWVLAEGWLDAREIAAPAAGAPAAAATGPASPASQERTVSEAAFRKVYDRSVKLSHAAKNSAENQAAIRLVNELARYGDPAARWFIVDRYDENSDIPKVVSPAEVIRYNLDLLLARPSNMPKLDFKLIFNVTAVTMKRREPRAFAAAFMDALRDDPRLQHAGGLGAVLGHLSFAPMACDAIAAFATRELRIQGMGKEGCDPASRDALIAYAKARGAAGVDSKARLAAREAIEDLARRMN